MHTVKLIAGLALASLVSAGAVGSLASTPAPSSAREPAPVGIATVEGLAGLWQAEHSGRVYHEMWMPPAHGQMTGALRSFDAEGGVRLLELLTMTETEEGLTYRVRHFDSGMTPWASEADGPLTVRATGAADAKVRFEPTAADGSLDSISFDLSRPDHLRVTIAFAGETQREPLVLDFQRVETSP